ncbi:hypothetical protein C8J56DRAFT_957000 [Mycena floridula]|nr:hypothetical protein C8J56DRAFT_957000 [Mycena floridula]
MSFLRRCTDLVRTPRFVRAYSEAFDSALPDILRRAAIENRALRVTKMPVDVQEQHVRFRFKDYGKIEEVLMEPSGRQVSQFHGRPVDNLSGKAVIVFEQADPVQHILHELPKTVSMFVLGQPVIIKRLSLIAANFIIVTKLGAGDYQETNQDILSLSYVPSDMSGEDINKYFSPYGTIHSIKRFIRYGRPGGHLSFAPGSKIAELVGDSAGMLSFSGVPCKISLLRFYSPSTPILGFRYVFPHPSRILDRSAIFSAENELCEILRSTLGDDAQASQIRTMIQTIKVSRADNEYRFYPRILGQIKFASLEEATRIWELRAASKGAITTPAGGWLDFFEAFDAGPTQVDKPETTPYDAPKKLKVPSAKKW